MPADRDHSSSSVKQAIDVGDTTLYTVSKGKGSPLVFVHGSLADYRDWNPQLRALSDRFQTVTYSRRYHHPNETTHRTKPHNVQTHANDLVKLIIQLELDPVTIVGNSYGAYIGLQVLHQRPDLINVAVLNDPPLLPWLLNISGGEEPLVSFLTDTWQPAKRAVEQKNHAEAIRHFVNGVNGDGTYKSLPRHLRERMLDNIRDLEFQMGSANRYPLIETEVLEAVDHPILLPTGERSPDLFGLIVDHLASVLENAESRSVPQAAHAPHLQNMREYNTILESFISEHTPA